MSLDLRSLMAVALAGCLLLLMACGPVHSVTIAQGDPEPEVHRGAGHGPPPHAPAHGYRYKQDHAYHSGGGVDLVFDSGLGVYAVVGVADTYYWDGGYLRIQGDVWQMSAYVDGSWEPCPDKSLPSGLRAKAAKKDKDHPGHGKGPAKRRPNDNDDQ